MIWSRRYRWIELVVGVLCLILLGAGFSHGQDTATHAGAAVTTIGILFSFATFNERLRLSAVHIKLSQMTAKELQKVALNLGLPAESREVEMVKKAIQDEIDARMTSIGAAHGKGLLRAEAVLLASGTVIWGFADWIFNPPPWMAKLL